MEEMELLGHLIQVEQEQAQEEVLEMEKMEEKMEEQEEKEPSIVLEDGAGNPGATNGGKNGTGGLLIINTAEFENNGKIESNGSNGGDAVSYGGSGGASGGVDT